MVVARVALGESGRLAAIPFTSLALAFSAGNAWTDAVWWFRGAQDARLSAPAVREMMWQGQAVPVAIVDGDGRRLALPPAQGVTTLEPFGALCFVYANNSAGHCEGVAIAVNHHQVVIRHHQMDVS